MALGLRVGLGRRASAAACQSHCLIVNLRLITQHQRLSVSRESRSWALRLVYVAASCGLFLKCSGDLLEIFSEVLLWEHRLMQA